MNDVSFVQITDAFGEFECESSHHILIKSLIVTFPHVLLEIASFAELGDHVDVVESLEDFQNLDNLTMTTFVKD